MRRRHDLREGRHAADASSQPVHQWLRGLAGLESAGADVLPHRALRVRVRAYILGRDPGRHDEQLLESLALLGADSNDASLNALRTVAREAPDLLAPVVESLHVALLLAAQDPALLAELAQAYYIEDPDDAHTHARLFDDRIRHHHGAGLGRMVA